MEMLKTIPVFILLFIGYLCNAQYEETSLGFSPTKEPTKELTKEPTKEPTKENYVYYGKHIQNSSVSPATETRGSDHVPERSLPTLVVAGVSIALVLLCILIVAVFWYAWKKSQEGSMELNPIPYGEAGVSLRSLSVPENQREWPLERAAQ